MTPDSIAELLQPYIVAPADVAPPAPDWPRITAQLSIYLELIGKWNARINLTAIRSPQEIVRRHFGESLFAGLHLGPYRTLLDFGSGAGFPGIPIQLLRPNVAVTLAESRSKKAAFLQEVVRSLALPSEVWAGRVEAMPAGRQFDTVALRAVDDMDAAIREAGRRASGQVLILGTQAATYPALSAEFAAADPVPMPGSTGGVLLGLRRSG